MKNTFFLFILSLLYSAIGFSQKYGIPVTKTDQEAYIINFSNIGTTPRMKINIETDLTDTYAIQSFTDTTLVFKSKDELKEYEKLFNKRQDIIKEKAELIQKIENLKTTGKTSDAQKLQSKYDKLSIEPIDIRKYINNRTYLKPGMKILLLFDRYDKRDENIPLRITVITDFNKEESIKGILEKIGEVSVVDGRKVRLDKNVNIEGGNRSKKEGGYKGKVFKSFKELETGMELELEGRNQPDGIFLVTEAEVFPNDHKETDDVLKLNLKKTIIFDKNYKSFSIGTRKFTILTDTSVNNYINKISNALIPTYLKEVSEHSVSYIPFKFYVVVDDVFNACAYPDGNVFINTGLLKAIDNSSQLAAVIGHEISHVTNKHGRKNYELKQKTDFVSEAAEFARKALQKKTEGDSTILGIPKSQIGVLVNTFGGPYLTSRYNRDYEIQADRCGLSLMEKAGYDPREASKMWETLHQQAKLEEREEDRLLTRYINDGTKKLQSIYSSHPDTFERYRNINLLIALNYQEKDFAQDKVKYQQQEIEYRTFKEKLKRILEHKEDKKSDVSKIDNNKTSQKENTIAPPLIKKSEKKSSPQPQKKIKKA